MNRRHYLALLGSGVVAGCSGGSSDVENNAATTSSATGGAASTRAAETSGATATEQTTAEQTTTGDTSEAVSIESQELRVKEGEYTTEVGALVDVINSGDSRTGTVELSVGFYDTEGNLLERNPGLLPTLGPGLRWKAYVSYHGDGKADSIKADGSVSERAPEYNPDSLPLSDVAMEKGEDQAVTTGTVKNETGSSISYLEVNTLYRSGKTVLTGGLDNVNDVEAGETWSFKTTAMSPAFRLKQVDAQTTLVSMSNY